MGTIALEALQLIATLGIALGLVAVVASQRPQWDAALAESRFGYGLVVCATIALAKLVEDVLGGETSVLDRSLLLWLHDTVPAVWGTAFGVVTLTGSLAFVTGACTLAGIGLWVRGRRVDAASLVLTPVAAGALIYVAKALVDRPRPTLWATHQYWGSSFPSGHTLAVAAVATSAYLVAGSAGRKPATIAGVAGALWVAAVGLSRLVLGVHWPSDVVAAACAGLLVGAGCHALVTRMSAPRARGPSARSTPGPNTSDVR